MEWLRLPGEAASLLFLELSEQELLLQLLLLPELQELATELKSISQHHKIWGHVYCCLCLKPAFGDNELLYVRN